MEQKGLSLVFGVIRPLALWAVLFGVVYLIAFESSITGAMRIIRRRETTLGTVSALQPEQHRTVVATYQVRGKTYETSTSLSESVGLPRFEDLRVGDQVNVEYDRDDPSSGIAGSAERVLRGNLQDLALFGLFLALPVAILEFRLRKYLRKPPAEAVS